MLYEYGREPWDYPDEILVTLCKECHQQETEERKGSIKRLLVTLAKNMFHSESIHDLEALVRYLGKSGILFRSTRAAPSALMVALLRNIS